MVKTPLSGRSILSMRSSMKSPQGNLNVKSPLGQLFSPTSIHFAAKKEEGELMGNKSFREDVLEPNGISIMEHHMPEEEWSTIAFSLGIPLKQETKPNTEVARFAQRVRRKKTFSDVQAVEAIMTTIKTMSEPLSLHQEAAPQFYTDAVPCLEELKNSIHRVPRPCPSISVGYPKHSFAHIDEELQKGIISNENGYPVDLGRVSQPSAGHYWPFFVVEVSEHSMTAAKHACAVSASSCNNALRLLVHAAKNEDARPDQRALSSDANTKYCFSMAVNGKIASLNVHNQDKSGRHVLRTIFTYGLDDDDDVSLLVDRIRSILVWGRYSRLPEVTDRLEALDRKVNGGLPPNHMALYRDDFDPQILKTLNIRASKNKKKRTVPGAVLPGWIRDGGIRTA